MYKEKVTKQQKIEEMNNKIAEIKKDIKRIETEIETKKEEVVSKKIEITDEERDLIERVVSAEIRGGDFIEQLSVAQVIYCRVKLWDSDIKSVLLAPKQFANPYDGEVSDLTKYCVSLVFDRGIMPYAEPVTYFYAHDIVHPWWADTMVTRGSDRYHTFMDKEN